MIVMVMSKVPPSLQGVVSRLLFEVKSGVFIGHISARVRDLLWDYCCLKGGAGWVFQAWSTNNEQRFKMRIAGGINRIVTDWEGVEFITEITNAMTEIEKKQIVNQ